MLSSMLKILMDKADDDKGGGAPKADAPPPKPGEQPPPKKDDPPAPAAGDKQYDELGYEIIPKKAADQKEGEKTKEGDPKEKAASKEPEKVENPATGYGDKPPEVVEEPPPKKADEPPKPPPTDLEKKLEGLHSSFANQVKQQMTELDLKGEQLDKFIAFKKQEQKDLETFIQNQETENKRQEKIRNQKWDKELRDDPAFGGDKFPTNLTRTEKILDQYGPEFKKELTDAKQMLRPSVMRMLARIADDVYPDRQMVHGDPPAPEQNDKDDKADNPLSFYTN
jgi:hypothetical protein